MNERKLWHDKQEEPKCDDIISIIYISSNNNIHIDFWVPEWTWNVFCIENRVQKWCYVSELKQDNIYIK